MTKLLSKWYVDELSRYSFIHKAYMKGVHLFLEYIVDKNIKTKRLARRITISGLQRALEKIRIEVGEKNNEGYRGNYYII